MIAAAGAAPAQSQAPVKAEAATQAAPNFFGSTALRLPSTPLDSQWAYASRASAGPISAKVVGDARKLSGRQRIEFINQWVNHHVKYSNDLGRAGRADQWSPANQTLARLSGDCEDMAILKMKLLQSAGMDPRNIYLAIVKDLVRRADHAVLVVTDNQASYVLDIGTDFLGDASRTTDYRPIFTFGATARWTHGYSRKTASS